MNKRNLIYFTAITALLVLFVVDASVGLIVLSTWTLISLLIVGFAYFYNMPMIFRKSSDGSIPLSSRWLFMPFLTGAQLFNAYKRATDSQSAMQSIIPNLYIGCRLTPVDLHRLNADNIDAVLDLTAEFDGLGSFAGYDSSIDYLNIPILDHGTPSHAQIVKACEWIDSHRRSGQNVLVHCALGRGRALFICAAYLIFSGNYPRPKLAVQAIEGERPKASLNARQRRALKAWADTRYIKQIKRKTVALIANPKAGGGSWLKVKQDVLNQLSALHRVVVYESATAQQLPELVRSALDDKADIIVACGGDGTVREVVESLVNRRADIPVGIIPLGTANALAATMFGFKGKVFPVNIACAAINAGCVKRIDVAECNAEVSLLLAGIGIEATMTQFSGQELKQTLGQLSYLEGFRRALNSQKTLALSAQFDEDDPQVIRSKSFVIANAAPTTSVLAQGSGEPVIDDGLLDVTWIEEHDAYSINEAVGALALSSVVEIHPVDAIQHKRCQSLVLEAEAEQQIEYVLDGESRCASRLNVKVLPERIALLYPDF